MILSFKKCANCYYNELCDSKRLCKYYHPIIDESIDELVDDYIERRRIKFRREWFDYIGDPDE